MNQQLPPPRRGRAVTAACALGAAVALALTGCAVADRGDGSGAPTQDGQIRATWWGGDSENQALNTVFDAFSARSGVEVRRESQAFDGYWDRLATQTAGGGAPDLIMQAGSQIPDYAGRDTLLDLTAVEGLDVDAVDEGLRRFGAVGDRLYGVVAGANAMGLVTNDAMLARAGVVVPDGEYGWDRYAQAANALHAALGPDVWGASDEGGDLISFILFVRDSGRQFYAEDGTLNATREDLTRWLEYWQALRATGGAPPADVTAEGQGELAASPFAKGRTAMDLAWTQDYTSYSRLLQDELSISLPPYDAQHPSLWMNAASLWSISASSANPDEAAAAITYMATDPEAIADLGVALGMPPSQAARDQLRGTLEGPDQAAMDYMDEVAATSTPLNRLWPSGFAELRSLLEELNEAVAFGSSTVPEAVDEFFARAESFE
ncbi:ABC transporter substrate-binding protein [Pseudonocardia sichuanensis]